MTVTPTEITAQIVALEEKRSQIMRAAKLRSYLGEIGQLEIAVRIPPPQEHRFDRNPYGCHRPHHDILPKISQDILRKHLSDALEAAISEMLEAQ